MFIDFIIFFETLDRMALNKIILWKTHYDTCTDTFGNNILRLNHSVINKYKDYVMMNFSSSIISENEDINRCLPEYKEMKNAEKINIINFKQELKLKDYCINCNYPVSFIIEGNTEERVTHKSALIDIYRLQSSGICVSNLLKDNTTTST